MAGSPVIRSRWARTRFSARRRTRPGFHAEGVRGRRAKSLRRRWRLRPVGSRWRSRCEPSSPECRGIFGSTFSEPGARTPLPGQPCDTSILPGGLQIARNSIDTKYLRRNRFLRKAHTWASDDWNRWRPFCCPASMCSPAISFGGPDISVEISASSTILGDSA